MERVYKKELQEVDRYMTHDRRSKFIAFQDRVVGEISSWRFMSELYGAIIEVKSRKDVDPDNPIKTNQKIALKLHKWHKTDPADSLSRISDIHDIAGVTIVCPFPSDVERLVEFIRTKMRFNWFSVDETKEGIRQLIGEENGGYAAYHIRLKGLQTFRTATCELQIKTVMIQSWGVKTHDLIYKPPGEIDARLQQHMEKISHTLQILDDQSEIVKSLIVEAWNLDRKRKQAAQIQMMLMLANIEQESLKQLFSFWSEKRSTLATAALSDPLVVEFEDKVATFLDKNGASKELSRIVSIYAIGRMYEDRNDFALDHIDDWIYHTEADRDLWQSAVAFRSCVAMSLGEYEEAIDNGRSVLKAAEETGVPNSVLSAKLNLAYFLSEAYYHRAFDEPSGAGQVDSTETEECCKEALQIVEECRDDTNNRPEFDDTVGAVLIACCNDEQTVRNGLDKCFAATQQEMPRPQQEAVSAFFSLHERRAFRKILANN